MVMIVFSCVCLVVDSFGMLGRCIVFILVLRIVSVFLMMVMFELLW